MQQFLLIYGPLKKNIIKYIFIFRLKIPQISSIRKKNEALPFPFGCGWSLGIRRAGIFKAGIHKTPPWNTPQHLAGKKKEEQQRPCPMESAQEMKVKIGKIPQAHPTAAEMFWMPITGGRTGTQREQRTISQLFDATSATIPRSSCSSWLSGTPGSKTSGLSLAGKPNRGCLLRPS